MGKYPPLRGYTTFSDLEIDESRIIDDWEDFYGHSEGDSDIDRLEQLMDGMFD